MKKRIVVTGLGLVCALGQTTNECFHNALNGISGITQTTSVDTDGCYATLSAEVPESFLHDVSHPDKTARLLLKATKECVFDANLDVRERKENLSVVVGSCIGGVRSGEEHYARENDKDLIKYMPISALAYTVASEVNAGGTVTNVANACAAGTMAIARACDLINENKADVVLAGGADAFGRVPYSGFLALKALDKDGCSPFSRSAGITLGEGAGMLTVESYDHAKSRNARIYCEIVGSGITADAYDITAPRPDGEGQITAIKTALISANLGAKDVDYVNAHGTGTAKNDQSERLSLESVFANNPDLAVSSTKSMTGHCLGAAGAIESVFCIKSLENDVVLPTIGMYDNAQPFESNIHFVRNKAEKRKLNYVMNNSFAFGGTNASIIFGKLTEKTQESKEEKIAPNSEIVVITGIGTVLPIGNTVKNFINKYKTREKLDNCDVLSAVNNDDYDELGVKSSSFRKMDNLGKTLTASGLYALKDGKYAVTSENEYDVGCIVGTSEGSLGAGCEFLISLLGKGNNCGSAFKFPNTVYNAGGGHFSIASGIKGYNATITSGPSSGIDSLGCGLSVIKSGKVKACLCCGADEKSNVIKDLISASIEQNLPITDGATSVFLELDSNAVNKNAKRYCTVIGYGTSSFYIPNFQISGSESALIQAINNAISDSGINLCDIDAVIGFSNGYSQLDEVETNVVKKLFENKPLLSVKETVGESRACSATLSCALGALILSGDIEKAYGKVYSGGNIVNMEINGGDIRATLVISYSRGGSYSAIVLGKING